MTGLSATLIFALQESYGFWNLSQLHFKKIPPKELSYVVSP